MRDVKRWGWRVKDAAQAALRTSVGGGQIRLGCQRRYKRVRNEARSFGDHDRRLFTRANLFGSARFGCRHRVVVLLLSRLMATTTLVLHRRSLGHALFHRPALIATRRVKRATPSARQGKQKAAQQRQESSEQGHKCNLRQNDAKKSSSTGGGSSLSHSVIRPHSHHGYCSLYGELATSPPFQRFKNDFV